MSLMPEMARIATEMVHDVLTAFVERDAEAAVRACDRDRAVDAIYNSIFRTLLGRELNQREHYCEKHGGDKSKSHASKRTLDNVYVSFQNASLALD